MRRHKHNLNHTRLMSGRFGELLPMSCMEMLPGDTFRKRTTGIIRLSPMVSPVMHPISFRIHTFFVPNRLIWTDWEDFIVDMNTTLSVPVFSGVVASGDVYDYLGVPPGNYSGNSISKLPVRAYNMIWNEFYRDQEHDDVRLQGDASLARIRWEKDYFTTARQNAQSGIAETVSIEFDQDVPVLGIGIDPSVSFPSATVRTADGDVTSKWSAGVGTRLEEDVNQSGYPYPRIPAGSVGGSMDINEWRRAMAWQRLSEHRNKYGSRYTDYLRFLGIRSSDARLQRPEYLGGGSSRISISEVLSTADTVSGTEGSPLGQLSGHGIAGARTRPTTYFAEEHGYMITLASIRPKTMYSTALERSWYRTKPDQYWQKEMEIMGDQLVKNGEIDAPGTNPHNNFGYVDRHREYREQFSGVSGEMRAELNYWHLAREFSSTPQLNSSFLECSPTERIFASSNNDTFQLHANNQVSARRLVSGRSRV